MPQMGPNFLHIASQILLFCDPAPATSSLQHQGGFSHELI